MFLGCVWACGPCGLWLGVGLSTIQARSATSPLKISVMMRKMMEITRSRWFPAHNHLHTYIHICMNEKKGGRVFGMGRDGKLASCMISAEIEEMIEIISIFRTHFYISCDLVVIQFRN